MTSAGWRSMTGACGMRNEAGTRPPSSSGASGRGWRQPGGSPGETGLTRSRGTGGSRQGRCGGGAGPGRTAGPRRYGPGAGVAGEAEPAAVARLEAELDRGPLAHGFAGDQRWTLGRIKTLIGWLFHVGYTVEGVWKLMRRHGWSCQVLVRQATGRDEAAIAVWKGRGMAGDTKSTRFVCQPISTRPTTDWISTTRRRICVSSTGSRSRSLQPGVRVTWFSDAIEPC